MDVLPDMIGRAGARLGFPAAAPDIRAVKLATLMPTAREAGRAAHSPASVGEMVPVFHA